MYLIILLEASFPPYPALDKYLTSWQRLVVLSLKSNPVATSRDGETRTSDLDRPYALGARLER